MAGGFVAKRISVAAWLTIVTVLGGCTWNASKSAGWPQGWAPEIQQNWYSATQGSRLMPLAWFKALEQADNARPFLDPAHMALYRTLPRAGSELPVGFAVDDNDDTDLTVSKLRWFDGQQSKEHWVGLNCSACHTGEVAYKGAAVRIDGGPALFDYQNFVEALDKALHATAASAGSSDPAKWNRFAAQVLTCPADNHAGCTQAAGGVWSRDTPANRVLLRAALDRLIAWEDTVERLNKTPLRYGFGRVDAFGHIFNKVALFTGAANPTANPADAPVSYPFLWDIYRHDKLQWNGIVSSTRIPLGAGYLDVGALGRNSGEVIGVFGDVAVRKNAGLGGYKSSIWADNLDSLEVALRELKPPVWPSDTFGKPDDTAAGKALFGEHCAGCHQPQPGTAAYKVHMLPLLPNNPNNTDPWMACNAITYRSSPGNLEGTPEGYLGNGPRYTNQQALLASMLATTVKGAMAGKKGQIIAQAGRIFIGIDRPARVVTEEAPDLRPLILDACFAANSPLMAYKARPLDGIWATAPYLHNGSVASLYELLLPPDRRLKSFLNGTRDYDPVKVGYSLDAAAPGNSFRFDTALPGNSNQGHDYGAARLSEADRLALLEYLKTL